MKMLIEGSSDCSNGRWRSRSPLRRASKRVFPKSPEQAQMPSPFRSRGGRRINAEGPCLISDLLRGALKSERLSAAPRQVIRSERSRYNAGFFYLLKGSFR